MSDTKIVRNALVKTWFVGPRKVRSNVKPYTKINVKPYIIITYEGRILCGEEDQLPLVFDNNDLAKGFAAINGLDDCKFKTMELDELVRMCRNPRIKFDSFYLIDHKSQIV